MDKAFIFDMDGVLLDSEKVWVQLPGMLVDEMDITLPKDVRARLGVLWVRPMLEEILAQGEWPSGAAMDMDACILWCRERMQTLYRTVVAPKAGALCFVRFLARRRIPCGVLTATENPTAMDALNRMGFTPYLRFVQSVTDMPFRKNEPACFEHAASRIGFPARRCVVVEDSLVPIRSARAAGCTVWGMEERVQPDAPETIEAACNRYFTSFAQMQAHCMRMYPA